MKTVRKQEGRTAFLGFSMEREKESKAHRPKGETKARLPWKECE